MRLYILAIVWRKLFSNVGRQYPFRVWLPYTFNNLQVADACVSPTKYVQVILTMFCIVGCERWQALVLLPCKRSQAMVMVEQEFPDSD
jgi:hypothetical protein